MQPFLFRRRHSQSWQLGAVVDGRRRQLSLGTSDKAEAERLLAEFQRRPWKPDQRINWKGEALEQYGCKTRLSNQQRMLAARAYAIIQSAAQPDRFAHLLIKPSRVTLTALGRIASVEFLQEVAAEVCALQLRGRHAENFIISVRGKKRPTRTFPNELRRAVLQLMRDFHITPDLAASYLQACAWDLEARTAEQSESQPAYAEAS